MLLFQNLDRCNLQTHYSLCLINGNNRISLYRLAGVNPVLLKEIVNFLELYSAASLELEAEATPTLHLAVPWFHKLMKHCVAEDGDSTTVLVLKERAPQFLATKFRLSTEHYLSTILNPRMKSMKVQ